MRGLTVLALIFSDTLLALLVWGVASAVQKVWGHGPLSEVAVAGIATNVVMWVGVRAVFGLYPGYGLNQVEELRRQTLALAVTMATVSVFAVAFRVGGSLSRLLLVAGFMGLLLLAPLARYSIKQGLRKGGLWGKPVVILGAGNSGASLVRALQTEWGLGYRPVAVFDDRRSVPEVGTLEGVPYGGTLTDAVKLGRKHKVDTAILAIPYTRADRLSGMIDLASVAFAHVVVLPDLGGVATSAVAARDIAGTLGLEIRHNLLSPWARRTKRAMDVSGVVVGGLLISPLLLIIAALIKLNSPGSALYAQHRMGSGGGHFRCWKFRTMHADADSLLANLLQSDAGLRSEWERDHKLRHDPRVTRIGRFLRKTSLDELPQIWNVLRGEMSLVGPRPYLPRESRDVGITQGVILRVPPGITGPWQVAGRNHASFSERVRMDAYYVRNWSVWLDLVILARTVRVVLSSRGAY